MNNTTSPEAPPKRRGRRPSTGLTVRTVTVCLPIADVEELDRLSSLNRDSRSKTVSRALRFYLAAQAAQLIQPIVAQSQ